jgi:hypothetical protein
MSFPTLSLTDASTGKRVRVSEFRPGDELVVKSEPILGYYYQAGHLTVYVNGTTPPALRSAVEEGRTEAEVLLVEQLPAGIREIDLTDCRREFSLRKAA